MADKNCFEIQNLSFSYANRTIFRDLSLCLPQGKVTTILGANGCGKSTLFSLLTKNLQPQAGQIFLRGQDIGALSLRGFAQKVAIVHQKNTAAEDITVEQLVSYGRLPFQHFGHSADPEKDRAFVERALHITGTDPLRKKRVRALSGGQQQRVWIAMALAQGTRTLLLDEPTTYLDIRYQLGILRLVKKLNVCCGMTVLMVLHDVNQAIAYSDELVALSPKGTLAAQGDPQKIITTQTLQEIYDIPLEVAEHNGRKMVVAV